MRILLFFFSLVTWVGSQATESHRYDDVYYSFGLFVNRITEQNPVKIKESKNTFENILSKTAELQEEDTLKWVKKIYTYLHKNYLKEYQHFTTLSQTLTVQVYDCLSATALMSLTLTYHGIDHEIVEQANHVLIRGKAKGRVYLLEMTYPKEGLILNRTEQLEILAKHYLTKDYGETRSIATKELAGLQLYNLAVQSYHFGNEIKSAWYIYYGEQLYPCLRMEEIKVLVSGV